MAKRKRTEKNYDAELPEICSQYHGWSIWVTADEDHKYIITAVLGNDEREIDRIEINGDEIDGDADIETVITDKIDEREQDRAEKRDWNNNYRSYMGLDDDPDWDESYDPD